MATPPHKVRYEAKATTNRAHKTISSARLRLAHRPRRILRPMSAFGPKHTSAIVCTCLLLTLSGHRDGVDDLIWEANKYPSSRQVRYDFGAMPLAGGIVVQQTIARDECVRFARACRHASAT